jgi:Fe-S oxidoreductase
MARGELVTDGWRSADVKDALDLCLGCKACRTECPVNVDMATYKAEFLHHHYRWRLRPPSHYSMGYLPTWARSASRAPSIANRLARGRLARRLAGVTSERAVPEFASEPFRRWFDRRGPVRHGRPQVLLWPDTFTNYLSPAVGRAAVAVLESAGFQVVLPEGRVCCGLTWISTGQLGAARRVARRSLKTLAPHLDLGLPIVGLEPSCTAAMRSDLPELVPGAARLAAQTFTLAEFLGLHAPEWDPPRLGGEALMQTHCHQRAVLGGSSPDSALLARAGMAELPLEPSCCGLAGNFGFEHYSVAQAVGERVLLPAVRAADPSTAILADGFSCRTQIQQSTGRRALHLAELLAGPGMDGGAGG